jgi:hypothetical protein
MGHPCPASDESAIHYNTPHTDPGSGADAPPQIRSCGRDIPVGSCGSVSRRTGSAESFSGVPQSSPSQGRRSNMQSNIAPAPGGFAPQHVELMAKDKVFFQRGPRSEPPDQGAPDQSAKIAHRSDYQPIGERQSAIWVCGRDTHAFRSSSTRDAPIVIVTSFIAPSTTSGTRLCRSSACRTICRPRRPGRATSDG